MSKSADIPYWRLSSFYFFYFAFLGAWVPFWNLFLEQELHFSAEQIGYLTAAMLISKVVGPYLWGWLADHFGSRTAIIRWGSFASVLCFLVIFVNQSYAGLFVAIFLYSFFWNAILAQYEVLTLSHLAGDSSFYSRIRLWGSIGFIVAVMGLGVVFDMIALTWLPHLLFTLLVAIWLASLCIGENRQSHFHADTDVVQHSSFKAFLQQVKKTPVLVFLMVSFLMQFSHGPYYTFFSIYLEQLGYSRPLIGALWGLGVIAEVALFMVMKKLLLRYSLQGLMFVTLLLTALRWFMIAAWAEHLLLLLIAQLFHAASFASFHAVSIEFLHRNFDKRCQGQGQAVYSAFSYGLGGALGAVVSGVLWQYGAEYLFAIAGLAVCLGVILMLWLRHFGMVTGKSSQQGCL